MTAADPAAEGLTGPFWRAVEEHRLVRPHCSSCDVSFFTPQLVCPSCRRRGWQWRDSSGRGSIYSHTTVHRAPVEGFPTPYVLAVVDLEEGWSMLTHIVDASPREVAIGAPVEVRWTVVNGRTLPAFGPVRP